MDVLPEVVDAVAKRATVMVDGAFCRGTDVLKAVAAGADAVGIGRLYGYRMAAGGQAGVVRMLELLEEEIVESMGLLGVRSEEHTSELQSLMRISYAGFCLTKKITDN